MKRYQWSGVEHIHMMRRVPRSYDMTRTHIMHPGVNKHVDVVLRCSPKHWKKKKVPVSVVRGEKKSAAVGIRANAHKGYVAVRRTANEQYETDRKAAVQAYETKYGAPSAANNALIHDMKRQVSVMAQKSAAYMEQQLTTKPVQPSVLTPPVPTPSVPTPSMPTPSMPTPPVPPEQTPPAAAVPPAAGQNEPLLSPETEEILRKGGYRRPTRLTQNNPYASNYSAQASTEEFHSLMESLEKSLDEAYGKYVTEPQASHAPSDSGFVGAAGYGGGYPQPADFSVSVNGKQEIKADPVRRTDESAAQEQFQPALHFADGGEHYIPEDELFDRELNRPDDSAASSEADFTLPAFPPEEEEAFTPPPAFPPEEEEAFLPPPAFPPEEEEEFLPPPAFPPEEEEDTYIPVRTFPEETEHAYTQEEEGYSPAPVSPNRNEIYVDDLTVSERSNETLFSRTGGQLKKVIGIIRGSANNLLHRNGDDDIQNENVEINYSDRSH